MEVVDKEGSIAGFRRSIAFGTVDSCHQPKERLLKFAKEPEVLFARPGGKVEFVFHCL
jgi:hypothetical protein